MQPEVHGRHTMVTLRSKHPASVVLGNGTSGLLSRAIVSICESLRDIAANNALPTRERRIGLIGDLAKLMEAMHHDHDLDTLKDARIHMTNLKSILSFDEDAALDSYSQFWAFVDGKPGPRVRLLEPPSRTTTLSEPELGSSSANGPPARTFTWIRTLTKKMLKFFMDRRDYLVEILPRRRSRTHRQHSQASSHVRQI